MYEVKLTDLRYLARFGNATVKLDKIYKFQIADIKRDGIYIPQDFVFIKGKKTEMKTRESFSSVLNHILTVKQGQVLLAERKQGKLIATTKFETMLNEKKANK